MLFRTQLQCELRIDRRHTSTLTEPRLRPVAWDGLKQLARDDFSLKENPHNFLQLFEPETFTETFNILNP